MYISGELKHPTQRDKCVTCHELHILEKDNSEIFLSCVIKRGCLEYITKELFDITMNKNVFLETTGASGPFMWTTDVGMIMMEKFGVDGLWVSCNFVYTVNISESSRNMRCINKLDLI